MNELTPQKEQSEKPKNEKWLTPYGRFMFRLLDGISIVFWSYVVIKLLFFDFDVLLVDYFFPGHTWLLNLKFFALIGALAISLIFADKGVVLFWCGYILLFPATLLLWKIPRFVLKRRRWVLGFAFVNAIISFFSAFKYNVLMAAALLISSAAILFGANKNVVWAAIILAVAILYIGYAHRFWAAIRPSDTFRLHTKIVSGVSKFATSSFALDDKIRGVPLFEPRQPTSSKLANESAAFHFTESELSSRGPKVKRISD